MVASNDGGFLLGGTSTSDKSGDKSENNKGIPDEYNGRASDYWAVKIDANGKKLWDKTLGGSSTDKLAALVATTDGGYLLGGLLHRLLVVIKANPTADLKIIG